MAIKADQEVYAQSCVTPEEVDVVELHDCFSTNELITYEALVWSKFVTTHCSYSGNSPDEFCTCTYAAN